LLLSVLSDHFVLVGFHLLLTPNKCTLLVHGEDHVSLCLLHLQVLDAGHLSILADHALNDRVDLVALLHVLLLRLFLQLLTRNNLLLNVLLVGEAVLLACLLSLPLDLILNFFGAQHNLIDLCVLLK